MIEENTGPLTEDERSDRDRLIAQARNALGREMEAKTESARALREIRDRKLYRDIYDTFGAFVSTEFGKSASWAYQRIELADVADDLDSAGVEPLGAAYQAGFVVQLRHTEPEAQSALRVRAVTQAREGAARHNRQPTQVDFKAACDKVLNESADASERGVGVSSERAAVHAHDGLVVVLPTEAVADPTIALSTILGRLVIPYDDALVWPARSIRETHAYRFARAEMDDVTDLVWPVLAPDPWESAASWAPEHNRATYFPDRLTAPLGRTARDAPDREITVLVAPGVDVLGPTVPERVAREVVDAAGSDPTRRYLLLTAHPGRAWQDGWPGNVYVVVEAEGTAAAVVAAAEGARRPGCPSALVVRSLLEPVPTGALDSIDWILVRGGQTKQAAYDSLRAECRADQFDRGRDVRARHSAYPALAREAALPRRAVRPPVGLQAVPNRTLSPCAATQLP